MYRVPTDEDAALQRERLIMEHLPQVRLIARRIHERLPDSVSLEDLVSTGILGLIAAVDNFDANHNVQLKTYAEHKIRGAILDSLRDLDWAPREKRKKAKQIAAAIDAAARRLQRDPTEEEIAAELQVPLERYHGWLAEVQGIDLENLERVNSDGRTTSLLAFIPDGEETLPSRICERAEVERLLAEAIERMPKMDRTVLGLYYQEEMSLSEIAQIIHTHVSRVSQLKAQAILRLRTYLERRLGPAGGGKK